MQEVLLRNSIGCLNMQKRSIRVEWLEILQIIEFELSEYGSYKDE